MFQEHQQYILEVAQNRRQLSNRLEELEVELTQMKKQALSWNSKID
jgi:hypothetical protein